MLPKIVTSSKLRAHLAEYLHLASYQVIIIKDDSSNKVLLDEKEFNRISSLANQFIYEDPEGKYRPEFEKEILARAKDNDIDTSVSSLQELL